MSASAVEAVTFDVGSTLLADAKGRARYFFEKEKGGRSACSERCAMQATYAHHPLYRHAGDSRPGQTNGEGSKKLGQAGTS